MSHTFNPYSFLPVPPPQAREAHPIGIYTTYYHARSAAQPERTAYYGDPADRYTAPPPQRNWKRDHKRRESSEHHENSGHHHYHGHSWRKEERKPSYKHKQDGAYDLPSLHAQGNGYAQDDGYARDGNGYAHDNGYAQENVPEEDDIYLARLNALRSFGRFILKTVGWFVKTLAFVLIMSFAVGCGAAAGVVLLMVGKPLVDWVAGGAVGSGSDTDYSVNTSMVSGDSTTSGVGLICTLPPLDVARAGAVAGAMAFLVPGLLFFLTEVTFAGSNLFVRPRRWAESLLCHVAFRNSPPPVYANDFARDERMDFVINAMMYVLATLCFAVGVGVWVVVLPPGLKDNSSTGLGNDPSPGNAASEDEVTFASAIETSLLGWAVIHVGFAGVLGLAMAVKSVPKWAMERVGV
ncbi:hypothetical protein K525DRAFT_269316 [Schizophyllum commune Loenen D]|nr:hypothetical protein K525DRAFT_269316 [Schizophyllum commune Loenen D]